MQENDNDGFFNVTPAVPTPDNYSEYDRNKLLVIERAANSISQNIRQISLDLQLKERFGLSYVMCVDFDVLYSSFQKNRRSSHYSFWADFSLEIDGYKLMLLPGTLGEIQQYASRQHSRAVSRTTSLGSAFQSAISSKILANRDVINAYNKQTENYLDLIQNLDGWMEVDASSLSSFIRAAQKSLPSDTEINFDYSLFYNCARSLLELRGQKRTRNARIDAFNYTLINALNERINETKTKYILLTMSEPLQEFGRQHALMHKTVMGSGYHHNDSDVEKQVWSPDYASLHQIFTKSTLSDRQALDLSWNVFNRINTYRSNIVRLMIDSGSTVVEDINSESWNTNSDLMIKFISSLVSRQETQSLLEQVEERMQLSRPYDNNDIAQSINMLDDIKTYIEKFIDRFRRKYDISEMIDVAPQLNLQWNITGNDPVLVEGLVDSRLVIGGYNYGKYFGIYFESNASLEKYLAVFDQLRNDVAAKVAVEKYHDGIGKEESHIVKTKQQRRKFNVDDFGDVRITGFELCKRMSTTPDKIVFHRGMTPWFDTSYERVNTENGSYIVCGVVSHLPMIDEFVVYASDLILPKFRNSDFLRGISKLHTASTRLEP